MTIPKHDDIRVPALHLLSIKNELKLNQFEAPLAQVFGLTDEEIEQEYESGNGKIFYDRISWALSYMNMAGLLQKPKRGIYQISELGKEKLKDPDNLNEFIAAQIDKRTPTKAAKEISIQSPLQNLTPSAELNESFKKITESTYTEIIDLILSKHPREFEKLVVALLQKMGYGGKVKLSGIVTKYSNDKGIDGIIKQDELGLDRIHIQAKRYKRDYPVSRDEVQKFVGALAGAQSNKGVFVTTSSYAKSAREYVENLSGSTKVVLIDGQLLAGYIYQYGLGMQIEHVLEIKKPDGDFWDEMEDDTDL